MAPTDEIEQRLGEMPSQAREDRLTDDLEAMIRAEQDPHWRGLLVVIAKLNDSIVADARLTKLLAQRLMSFNKTYLERTDAQAKILNQGIGGWKAFLVIGTLIGGLLVSTSVWILNRAQANMEEARHDRDALREETIKQAAEDARIETRLDTLESLIRSQTK